MKLKSKKALALLLVLVQLLVLLPIGTVAAKAVDEPQTQTPQLNKTIVGTVRFPSFNYLGDSATGEDGTDYQSTFYYTDDYFARSAVNDDERITGKVQTWEMLKDKALAACSMDFAMASCSSAVHNVLTQSSRSWANSDYSNKASNVIQFLGDCGFQDVEHHDVATLPRNDSIGFTLARKTITVWNDTTRHNESYTLIAVGIRGAGYAAEWASNVTIGDPDTKEIGENLRHYGFDSSAQKVCKGIRDYLGDKQIEGNVKYWVTGFSRSAAVANLVAGYLTDNTDNQYHTQQRDVYGYTFECPQAASTRENALNYKNIYNILNPMDAVPKVSPDEFEHQRLGVDYQMPYHGTPGLSPAEHSALYRRMFEVLKTIAVGRTFQGTYKPDPLVEDAETDAAYDGFVSPDRYPYDSKMTIYRVSGTQLIEDAISGVNKLMTNMGTVPAQGNLDHPERLLGSADGGWYIDDFIDNLIDVFVTSNAWEGGVGIGKDPLENREIYIRDYQNDLRTLMGYFIDFEGPAFLNLIPKVVAQIRPELTNIENAGLGLAFLNFYNDPTGTYQHSWRYTPLVLIYRAAGWWGQNTRAVLASQAKSVAVKVANKMTESFPNPEYQRITRAQMNASLQNAVDLLINLYAYELSAYESQYLGTTLRYLNTILCTHEQETVLSWIMSLDDMHMNRSCRTLTVPASADVTLYEFRDAYRQYDGELTDDETTAPVVAEIRGGDFVAETLKDQRITLSESDDSIVIRYPASLKIRADVKVNSSFNLSAVTVQDYQTKQAYTKVSDGKAQFADNLPTADYSNISADTAKTNAAPTNSDLHTYGTISKGDTLHILADDIAAFDEKNVNTYSISLDKAPKSVVAEYTIKTVLANPVDELVGDTDDTVFGIENRNLLWEDPFAATDTTYNYTGASRQFAERDLTVLADTQTAMAANTQSSIETRHTVSVTPAASIYYDDTLITSSEHVDARSGAPDYKSAVEAVTNGGTTVTKDSLVSFRFTGTRVDLYMNTTSMDDFVSAYVLDSNGNRYKKDGLVTGKTTNIQSENIFYNVPTISFSDLPRDTYTLVVLAPTNGSYTLDGVRVYDETKATYASVREALLKSSDWTGENEVSGTVYLDYGKNGQAEKADYTAAGPKGEVYLKKDNGVAFEIGNYEAAATYRIGLASADGNSVQVKINDGTPFTVSATTHMFYDLDLTSKNVVIQVTGGSGILSVTDVEETLPTKLAAPRRLSLSVSPALMRYAVSLSAPAEPEETAEPSPEVTEEPTPDVTPEPTTESTPEPTSDISSMIQQLLSSFVSSLFGSISRLFGN